MHVLAPNQVVEKYPYSIGNLRKDNPKVSFPKVPDDALLERYGMYRVQPTPRPEITANQNLSEETPVLQDGKWVQVWKVTDATPEEIAERLQQRREQATLTAAQFRLGLLAMGELDNVEAAIPQAPREIQIMWEYETVLHRSSETISNFAHAMGYTDQQLDELFGVV